MRVIIALIFLVGLVGACGPSPKEKNSLSAKPDAQYDEEMVYTISCQGPRGIWTSYQTTRHPRNSYCYRSGVWNFLTIEGTSVWASNCIAQLHK